MKYIKNHESIMYIISQHNKPLSEIKNEISIFIIINIGALST